MHVHGTVYLVGAGPGDPDLLTVRAVKALRQADAVVYDNLVSSEILRECPARCELHFAGKAKGNHSLAQEEIQELLVALAGRHRTVVRLKGGDPFIFGRGGEEVEFLHARGLRVQVVPGITAAAGAAAALRLPLTHRGLSSGLVFITGHRQSDGDYHEFLGLDLSRTTYVVYMGLTVLAEILERVCLDPTNRSIPACAVERATRGDQRVVMGTVESLAGLVSQARMQSPVLIVLGRVVGLLSKRSLVKTLGATLPPSVVAFASEEAWA